MAKDAVIEKEDMSAIFDCMDMHYEDPESRVPVICDMSDMKSISREARTYPTTTDRVQHGSVSAFVTSKPVSAIIGNFYLKLDKPKKPTKLFASIANAEAWLEEIGEIRPVLVG